MIALVLLITGIGMATVKGKDVKLTGYIIDNACAAKHAKDADVGAVIKGHSKACAQMPGCVASGHQLFVDGKLYKFDKSSETKIADVVKNAKSDKGLQVNVDGTLDGETLHVNSISEASS